MTSPRELRKLNSKGKPCCQGTWFRDWHHRQCDNAASTPAGFCKLHDPGIQAAKREARHAEWKARWDAQTAAREAVEEKAERLARWIKDVIEYLGADSGKEASLLFSRGQEHL